MIDRFSANATPSVRAMVDENQARPLWQQMKRGRGSVHEQYYGEATLLHLAVRYGNVHCARVLLAHGANVNVRDEDDLTPLHDAAWRGHAACICVLLLNGADVNATNNLGRTPLHKAAWNGLLIKQMYMQQI